MKFIYKNEKEKIRFVENYEKALLLFNKLELFGNYFSNDSSRSSCNERKLIDKRIQDNLELNSDCKIDCTYLVSF